MNAGELWDYFFTTDSRTEVYEKLSYLEWVIIDVSKGHSTRETIGSYLQRFYFQYDLWMRIPQPKETDFELN